MKIAPIAILGCGCRLPDSDNPAEFWELLWNGHDAVRELPPERLDRELYFDSTRGQVGKTYSSIGGCLKSCQARSGDDSYDLSHRIFCDVALEALAEAGYADGLQGQRVGVYAGHSGGTPRGGELVVATLAAQVAELLECLPDFRALPTQTRQAAMQALTGQLRRGRPRRDGEGKPCLEAQWIAGLLVRQLGLAGPQLVVDAACASSLVALSLAALALTRGEIDLAIVGGSSYNKTESLILFSHAQSCSASGSRPFDAEADGLISSEGVVAMVLKRADAARRDGDSMQAVIRSIGLSSDGRGRSLWAPRAEGQLEALQRCYAGVDAASVQYIEAHATSTQLGDATELESLSTFFGPHLKGRQIPIGSVKSNLGHTLETAGLASLLKVVLALRHRGIPHTINVDQLNPGVDWSRLPFVVQREPSDWPAPRQGETRRAGVSAFGVGGLNVHLVVEEPGGPVEPVAADEPLVAVVGRGVVVPGARNLGELKELLGSGQSQLGEPPAGRWPSDAGLAEQLQPWHTPTRRGGYITNFEFDAVGHKIPPKQVKRANPVQLMLLDATNQALAELGSPLEANSTAVVVGASFCSDFGNQMQVGFRHAEIRREVARLLAELGLSKPGLLEQFDRIFFERYSALLDETGGFTCSSLASRLTKAHDWRGGALALDVGETSSEAALKVGCDLLRGGDCSAVVVAAGQHSMDLVGFESLALKGRLSAQLPGEGVGVVILKTLDRAQQDGDRIYGLLHTAELASGLTPESALELVVGPALSDPGLALADAPSAELAPVLERVCGKPLLPSLAAQFGALHAAGGMLSLLRASLCHPQERVVLAGLAETGQAAQLIFEGAGPRSSVTARVARYSAHDPNQLATNLREGRQGLAQADPVRLVAVAPDQPRLAQNVALAADQLAEAKGRRLLEEQGIFYCELGRARPRIAYLFSGQGSQYQGMLRDLVSGSAAAAAVVRRADAALEKMGLPGFGLLAWQADERLDADPVVTQLAVLIADQIAFAVLDEQGYRPDCVCGHSFGEIPALVAAGVMTFEDALELTQVRAQALLAASPDGGLLSVAAPPQRLEPLVAELGLYFTHYNAAGQTVVGGLNSQLAALESELRKDSMPTRRLKVPGALHTPLVASAQTALEARLARLELRPPTILFYSNVTNQPATQVEVIRQNLVRQLVEPVRFGQLLDQLVNDGVGLLVEVGPKQVLTQLARQNLKERNVIVTSVDHPRRQRALQWARLEAAFECVDRLPQARSTTTQRGLGSIDHFDATRPRLERVLGEDSLSGKTRTTAIDARAQAFLLDHVADLTGYPRSALKLEWELEADLGIDSIKRTQLLGELRDAFGLDTSDKELANLRSLKDILEHIGVTEAPTEAEAPLLPRVSGQAYESARLRGRAQSQAIRAALRHDALKVFPWQRRPGKDLEAGLDPATLEELRGLAEGAGVHLYNLIGYKERHGTLPGSTPDQTQRYLMRMVECPLPLSPTRSLGGASLIIGDNALSRELASRLRGPVHILDTHRALTELKRGLEALGPLPHLFITTAWVPGELERPEHYTARITTPFWLCQEWLRRVKGDGLVDEATVVAVTRLGGGFGFGTPIEGPDGGFLAGLLKSMRIENWVAGHRDLTVKVIDCGPDISASDAGQRVLRELCHRNYELEIGEIAGQRALVTAEPQPVDDRDGQAVLPRGNWVCTGGARGITAHVARELAGRFGLKLHLIGRAPGPSHPPEWRARWLQDRRGLKLEVMDTARSQGAANPVKSWEAVEKGLEIEAALVALHEAGLEAHYHSCDLSDRDRLAQTLQAIRADGPIRGVLHGAGATRDSKFEQKDHQKVGECLGAKVLGTHNLMSLMAADPLDFFVAFGSISGRFGANGHADYSAANEMMAKLVAYYRQQRPEVGAVTFHWHAWGDVGMAVKGESQLGLELVNMNFMPAAEGVAHLIAELQAGAPRAEVLITDEHYYRRFYHAELFETQQAARPLLGTSNQVWLDPEQEAFLRDHRVEDVPVLPLVVALELACEAQSRGPGPIGLRRVRPAGFLKFHEGRPRQVEVARDDNTVRLLYAQLARDGTVLEARRTLLEVELVNEMPVESLACPEVPDQWEPVAYSDSGQMYHGPSLRTLRRYQIEGETLWGELVAPPLVELAGSHRSTVGWRLPSAILDGCLYAAGILAWKSVREGHTVPATIGELWVGRLTRPGERCVVRVQWIGEERFEIHLWGDDGQLMARAHDYRLAWLGVPNRIGA
ncbi:MAG: beta-ketoacyl synthase N-terminal-like domain-containing protein [Vulcanimicrobiota bacterium]